MTLTEHIAALEAARAAKAAGLEAIVQKSMDGSRSMDESEQVEFDEMEAEIRSIDEDLTRLRSLEKVKASRATPALGATSKEATESRGGSPAVIMNREPEEHFKGQNYTRLVIAKTLAQIEGRSAVSIANGRWGKSNPTLVSVIKADVEGGGTSQADSDAWGFELASANNRFTGDFIEFLYGATVYNRLPLRQVPANIVIKGQDGAATGYWVGEAAAIPVTAMDFMDVTLGYKKVAALAVITLELMRESSPAAEMLVRDALVNAAVQRLDATFLSADAATAAAPAGMLNGVTAIGTHGSTAEDVRADIASLYAPFITAKNSSGLQLVMNPSMAKALQLMRNALGQREFEGVNQQGGTLEGDPVVTGDNVNAAHLILLKPSDIYRIGDRGVEVSMSRDASIEMANNPAMDSQTPTAATGKVVSMFQTESVALKVVMPIDFAKRRSGAVQYINDADYGAVSSA